MGAYAGTIKRVDKDRQGGWIDRGCIFDGDWRREQVTFDVRVEQIDCAFPLEEGAVVSFDLEEFQEGQEAVLATKAVSLHEAARTSCRSNRNRQPDSTVSLVLYA